MKEEAWKFGKQLREDRKYNENGIVWQEEEVHIEDQRDF